MNRLKEQYKKEIIPLLMAEFGYKTVMEAPKIDKVVVNCGVGKIFKEQQKIDQIKKQIGMITGQKPAIAQARKSIAGFKIRSGMPIGIKATIRGERMYEFLDRLINITLPRTRDFSGISDAIFDGKGNASIGIKDASIFPELSMETSIEAFSLEITIATTANTDKEAKKLLASLNFPFKEK